jgi:hypothetical protein
MYRALESLVVILGISYCIRPIYLFLVIGLVLEYTCLMFAMQTIIIFDPYYWKCVRLVYTGIYIRTFGHYI